VENLSVVEVLQNRLLPVVIFRGLQFLFTQRRFLQRRFAGNVPPAAGAKFARLAALRQQLSTKDIPRRYLASVEIAHLDILTYHLAGVVSVVDGVRGNHKTIRRVARVDFAPKIAVVVIGLHGITSS
jgi:hypothetical protein